MSLNAPRLDDRTFQDLVQEAMRRIPLYTPEWTDHNLSDPGITLLELFAWLMDIMLYRLNRVPDRHYVKFMELIGMKLREPEYAKTWVTLWLSAPQENPIDIPNATEISTTRTETEPSIIFSTDNAYTIRVAKLDYVVTSAARDSQGQSRKYVEQNMKRLTAGFEGFYIFAESPHAGDAVYFGFEEDLSYHILGLELDLDLAAGAGIDPTQPPYSWQALSSVAPVEWTNCEIDMDGTRGFNMAGLARVHLPKMVRGEIDGRRAYWVRVRLNDSQPGVPTYRRSPLVKKVGSGSWGITVPATHASLMKDEFLGRSDGTPGQKLYLQNKPVLPRLPNEQLTVRISNEELEIWTEVPDFSGSGPEDRHYTIDSASGEVRFGPVMPQRDGTIRRYGMIPPRNSALVMRNYRHGGGAIGNVQKGALNVLKSSIPYIDRVSNRQPATGGLDQESIEDAKLRVPGYLRSLGRAVTAPDFEYLALQSVPGDIARVFALQPPNSAIGEVKVLLIPRVVNPNGYIGPEELQLDEAMVKLVRDFLDMRRLITTRLDVTSPAYYWVQTRIRLRASAHFDAEKVREAVEKRLFEYLNPIIGGPRGKGWPFGRDLHVSDLIACLQTVPGIDFIRSIELFPVTWSGGKAQRGEAVQTLEIVAHGVVASQRHDITIDSD